MICPVNRRVEENTTFNLVRIYPGDGRAAVKVGQSVSAADVVAHCEVSAGQRLVKIAHALGVSGKEVVHCLTRKIGDRIYEGEIIARRRSLFGVKRIEVKSPSDGVITEIDQRGDVILKFLPKPVRLVAGADGKVLEVGQKQIVISTQVSSVKGFVSIGKSREGTIVVIAGAKDFILPGQITSESEGKILVGGALLERGSLEKAVTLGVRGIITGGVNYRDFKTLAGGGDIGTSLIVTEGFGTSPMGNDVWSFLKKMDGRAAFMVSEANRLIIPRLGGASAAVEVKQPAWRSLKVGDKVRFFQEGNKDLVGMVESLPGNQILNSGVLAEVAQVSFASGEKLPLPAANLEILE